MRSSRFSSLVASVLAILIAAGPMAPTAAAQYTGNQYSKPKPAFPNFFQVYTAREVPEPNFANSGRIGQIIRDGKIYLSLSDAVALGLENNLDLAIARYNLAIADTDLLRTSAGGSPLGVNTGVVSGTPGGTGVSLQGGASGGGAGGTSTGAGGAGTGAGGIVTSTAGAGPSIDSFDPVLTGSMAIEHATTPLSNTVVAGVSTSMQNTGAANYGYSQGFATGTLFQVGFNNSRITSNSTRTSLMPQLSSSVRVNLRQHLLSGFGIYNNTRLIRIAKNNREISDVAFRQQIESTTVQIQNLYWDLVNAYESVKVQERALALAQKTEQDNRKQVEIGTLAPIEIVRAQATVASVNQNLIIAQTALQYQQLLMKNAITRNENDPVLAAAEVIPTDTMSMAGADEVQPTQDLVSQAMQHRPELVQARIDLQNRDINKKGARNALLPTLDFVAFYGTSALGGDRNPNLQTGLVTTPTLNTGYGNVLSKLFGGDFPDYQVGFSLTIPLRNRSAQATQVRAELEYRQAQMRMQQLQNTVAIGVRNAQYTLQQSRARVQAAEQQRELALQSLDAENKKYALGASTNTAVLQAQSDLANAEGNVVSARTAYQKARVALDQATAQTLQRLGINIQDAETGNVQHLPTVPGVVPRSDQAAPGAAQPPNASVTATPLPSPARAAERAVQPQFNTAAPPELQ